MANSAKNEGQEPAPGVSGRLIGVGVGPGDPGLVTLRAVELVKAAKVIAYPVHREGAGSRAYDTVRHHAREGSRRLPLLMPMTRDASELEEAHARAAEAIAAAAADGTDVVYLSLGDPLLYSTFGYLAERFPGEVEVISGVSAMGAMAAALGKPLAARDTPLAVVTGSDHASIAAAIEINASLVIIKPRALTEASLDIIERAGAFSRASAAVELGGELEEIIDGIDRSIAASLPYFSIIWIQPEKED